MLQTQGRCDSLLETLRTEQHKVTSLEEALADMRSNKQQLEQTVANLEEELSQQQATHMRMEGEKEVLLEGKAGLREELAGLKTTVGIQRAELEAATTREQHLNNQMQHITEVCKVPHSMCSLLTTDCLRT